MMAASGRGIRGKGGREEAGARPLPESAGSKGNWEAGDPPLAGGGEPRGVGVGYRRPRCEKAPRGGRGGGSRGPEESERARAGLARVRVAGEREGEERAGGSSRRGRGRGGSGGALSALTEAVSSGGRE